MIKYTHNWDSWTVASFSYTFLIFFFYILISCMHLIPQRKSVENQASVQEEKMRILLQQKAWDPWVNLTSDLAMLNNGIFFSPLTVETPLNMN